MPTPPARIVPLSNIRSTLEAEMLDATPRTIAAYASALRLLVEHTGKSGGWTRDELMTFFHAMRERGYSKGYVRFIYTAIKAFLRHSEVEMPVARRLVPGPKRHEMVRPAFTPDMVGAFIEAAKEGKLRPQETALVALSSVYGFRRTEMCRLERDRVGRLTVVTAKTKAPRTHTVPDNLEPWLTGYQPMGEALASQLFHRISRRAGMGTMKRSGWHSIRRAVATALINAGAPVPQVKTFMAWSPPQSESAAWYYTPDIPEIEQAVFALHPFLGLW